MKDNPIRFSRSIHLASPAVLGALALAAVVCAFFGQWSLAAALMFVFLLAGGARLWAWLSIRRVEVRVRSAVQGLFPGEEAAFDIEIRNNKFLPLVWLELFFPLSKSLCLVPEESRQPDDWEISSLQEEGSSCQLVGEKRFSFFLWYETLRFSSRWTAQRRGIYSTEYWSIRTGDGFGLCQAQRRLPREHTFQFAVYPQLIRVQPDLFLRNLWNADTGTRGVMEDITVIRSSRDYQTSDSLKHINWRLTARGLPLTVNVYEDILPKSAHFLFDGESFSGPEPHLEEMEEALSILASELVRLESAQVRCSLSLCRGAQGREASYFDASTEELLRALAGYNPLDVKMGADGVILPQQPVFDTAPLFDTSHGVGRFYYLAYSTASLADRALLRRLDPGCTSVLTYEEPEPFGEYETLCLTHLKEVKGHE